ncbi:hypothetical protein NDO74_01475 [Haloferax sp. S2CR25-2]|nr:hypothetical protein [Haloferax sp. S2CR25]MDS0443084.1 hypothetical protein [Haloferax sp. S2CR25-2]
MARLKRRETDPDAVSEDTQDEVTFHRDWDADSDSLDEELFGGSLANLEPTLEAYDPDDAAPWA